MPFNPQTKVQSNICAQILAKFVKQQESISQEKDSVIQNPNLQITQGKWEDYQNLEFIIFIDYHNKIFSSKQRRKSEKIFKILSKVLGNRTPAQCRSHYQKVMIKFKTIAKLKKHFKQYFGEQLYNKNYETFVTSWKQTHLEENEQKKDKELKQTTETGVQTEPLVQFEENPNQFLMYWQMQQYMNSFFSQPQLFWNYEAESCK